MTTEHLLQLWEEGRTRFSKQLPTLTEADLPKKLSPAPNSIGFLLRHIGDVELLFAKNVFNQKQLQVHAATVISQKDTGEWTSLADLLAYTEQSYQALKAAIELQNEEDWATEVTTKEFGTKTRAEALGRIVTHTSYHVGQLAMILKYGSIN